MMLRNKPRIEIMAEVYDCVIKYLEIELLLSAELFGDDKGQFSKILVDALSQVRPALFPDS